MNENNKMNEEKKKIIYQIGYLFSSGFWSRVYGLIWIAFAIYFICVFFDHLTGCSKNDSDKSNWNRSGFNVLIDAKTGVEYLSDGHGGLIIRAKKEDK